MTAIMPPIWTVITTPVVPSVWAAVITTPIVSPIWSVITLPIVPVRSIWSRIPVWWAIITVINCLHSCRRILFQVTDWLQIRQGVYWLSGKAKGERQNDVIYLGDQSHLRVPV